MPSWRRLDLIVVRLVEAHQSASHYSGGVISSHAARESWIAPDRLPLPFYQRDMPLWRRINLIVERWVAADPIASHYSRSVISSHAARESWIAPDRLPLPF